MAVVSKSRFKPQALEFFRQVQQTGEELIITDNNKPVLKIIRYSEESHTAMESLRDTVLGFDDPLEPVGQEDWEALR